MLDTRIEHAQLFGGPMRVILVCALALSFFFLTSNSAFAASKRIKCPVVVDRESGEYSNSRSKYYCYEDSRDARRAGYERHSFSDDSCSPGGGDGGGGSADLNLTGPGEKKSVVFSAASGGIIAYSFPGGEEFEIDVYNAATERRVERLLETSSAGASSVVFSAQTFPIYIKVEGPGAWTAGIEIN